MAGRYSGPGLRDPETGGIDPRELRHRLKGWLAVLMSVAVLGGGLIFAGTKAFNAWTDFRTRDDYAGATGLADIEVTIPKDSTVSKIGTILAEADVVKSATTFKKVATGRPDDVKQLKAGRFRMRTQISSDAAMDQLIDPTRMVRNMMTLAEGQRLSQQLEALAKGTKLPPEQFQAALAKPQDLGLPEWAKNRPEGLFFPDTYEIGDNPSALGIMKQTVAQFNAVTTQLDFVNAAKASPAKDPYTALIVASIIEKEVFREEDRPKVARVFYNRIAQGMALQSDATVAYAVNKTGTIWTTDADRKSKSPYNTYAHKGLPPGPIGAPSKRSLDAAIHPAEGGWLYFVPIDLNTGETEFNDTYEGHLASSAKLQAWCTASDENRKKCA